MAAKKQGWLDPNWPFRHTEVRLNTDTNLIKLVAMAAMLVDHLGAAVFPQYRVMRIIGRIAFPIYAYCIAVGCVYTRDIGKYLQRLAILALVSQPIYVLALNHTNYMMFKVPFSENPLLAIYNFCLYSWKDPSILLTLAIGVAAIWSLRQRRVWTLLMILIVTFMLDSYFDYGVKGVLLMLLLYAFCNAWYISLPVVAGFMLYWGLQGSAYNVFDITFGIQLFAMLALPFIYIPMHTRLRLNKWIFYAYYPAHLLVVLLAKNWNALTAMIFR